MQKVITINLNGRAYQLEEAAYDALRAYLNLAEVRLSDNPDRAEILGPIPAEPNGAEPDSEPAERALIRIPRTDGLALARALHAAQAARSARKDGAPVRVQLDPAEVA